MRAIAFNFEIRRKIFHLYSLIIPFLYLFIPRWVTTLVLFLTTVSVLYLDISRHYNFKIREFTNKFFSKIIRSEEASGTFRLSGASYMILGFFLTALLFPKGLAITSWLILIISDCLAAIVGTKIGTPADNGKSLEGSGAFLSSAIFISMLVYFFIGYNTSFLIIIISSTLTTIVEFYSKHLNINDNLLIPLTYCFSTTILTFISSL